MLDINWIMITLIGLTIFFSLIAFLSKEAFFFALAGVLSLVFGIYLSLQSIETSEGWTMLLVGVCMIFYGLFMPIAGLRVSLKGGRSK